MKRVTSGQSLTMTVGESDGDDAHGHEHHREHRVERLCGAASGLRVGAARPPRARRRRRRRSDASPVGPHAEERRKAVELITRVFPGAEVKTQGSSSLGQVIIKHNATTVIAVKQRDLFSKYRWPAAPKILERLEMLKEDLED